MDRQTVSPALSIETRWAASLILLSLCATSAVASGRDAATLRSGTLVFTVAEGEPVEIPRLRTDVQVDVNGIVARVELRQRFRNPSEQWAEGIYAFPLPANAAIERISTAQDGKLLGDARRKVNAQQLYDRARGGAQQLSARPRAPSLFRAPIADIAPRATLEITITYVQILDHRLDRQRLRVPLAANQGPLPDLSVEDGWLEAAAEDGGWVQMADRARGTNAEMQTVALPRMQTVTLRRMQTVTLRVNIDAGLPLAGVISRHHEILVTGRERTTVITSSERAAADADFELEWGPDARKLQRMPLARATPDSARLLPISND